MPTVHAMLQAPLTIANWLGVGVRKAGEAGEDIIFLCHGTPRRMATELERQLRYLRRVFNIVPLEAFAASGTERKPSGQQRQAAIAFDDGLRSNVQVAYPILRALGIPATFFVCPGLIEERKWLWTHEARRRLRFAEAALREELAAELNAPSGVEAFVQWMKELELPDRKRAEARLREATAGFVPSASDHEACDLAEWHELRALDPSVVIVGSHSMTHPILPRMSTPEIEVEVRESRRIIEEKLGRPAELFSYPNRDFDWRSLAAVRRHYRAAVVHRYGMPADPQLLPSVHLPRGVLRLAWKVNRRPAMTAQRSRQRFIPAGTPTS